ncbi:MAG: hypothetical protein II312_00425, partial [Lachnospiraceae bacterium]|nr:hypothetical protein [Lachnospiraceae bacterium]
MGLKKYIRERLIAAVQYAVREELKNQNNITSTETENVKYEEQIDRTEEIIARLDKQIERWTWERYKRTDKLLDELGYELDHDLNKGVDRLDKKVSMSIDGYDKKLMQAIDKQNKKIKEETTKAVDEKIKYWTAKRFEQIDKQIERWTWERYKRSEDKLLYIYKLQNQISELLFQQKKVPYIENEKIRIVFLFQVASF